MKKLFQILLSCLLFTLTACTKEDEPVVEQNQTYAVWFSYLDMQKLDTSSEEAYRDEIGQVVMDLSETGISLVYVHAVAFTDSMYNSEIYHRSTIFEGTEYDPLAIFIELAKAQNIEVEAWINPYRSVEVGNESLLSENNSIKMWIDRNDERVRQVNGRWYLNPAYPEVRNLVTSITQELIDNYDIAGIHIDDYFYPEGLKDNFDAYVYGLANAESEISRMEFRQAQTTELVRQLHELCADNEKRFTVSVAGNNENNLTMYYANVEAWAKAGYIDMLIPQIYWGYQHPVKPYTETLQEFVDLLEGTDVPIMAGIAAYKIGTTDAYAGSGQDEWLISSDMLVRQSQTAEELGCIGSAYFRYASIFMPNADVEGSVGAERLNLQSYINQ